METSYRIYEDLIHILDYIFYTLVSVSISYPLVHS